MEVNFDYFRENFGKMDVDVIEIKKYYFYKYIILNVDDGKELNNVLFVKALEDLKKLYKSVGRYFSNFPIGKLHDENLVKIITFAREELRQGRTLLLEFIYAFLFKTKSYNKYRKVTQIVEEKKVEEVKPKPKLSNSKSDGELEAFNEDIEKESNTGSDRRLSNLSNLRASQDPGSKNSFIRSTRGNAKLTIQTDPIKKLFKDLFQRPGFENSTSYQRLLFFEHLLSTIEVKRTRSCVYEAKFGLTCDDKMERRVINFSDKCMFFYFEERNFLTDKYDFSELFVLIKIEGIEYRDNYVTEETIITIKMNNNLADFVIVVKHADKISFLFSLCVTIMKKQSSIVNLKKLPFPLDLSGSFTLSFEEVEKKGQLVADPSERVITVESELIKISFQSTKIPRKLILPIINVFDVYNVITKRKRVPVETFEILELNFNQNTSLREVDCCKIGATRLSRYMGAFTYETAYNFQESRFLKTGIKKNVTETKYAVFRLKRLIAFRITYLKYLSNFLSFQYPLFTSVVLLLSLLINCLYSPSVLLIVLLFSLILYNHPDVQPIADSFLQRYFLDPSMLHKDYIPAKIITENQASRNYYLNMDNIYEKSKDTSSLRNKINNAVGISGKIPVYLHSIVDYLEKIINIFKWRNKRKSEVTLFILVISCLAIYLFTVQKLYVVYVGMRFFYGYGYFTRVKKWNQKVLAFIIPYFIVQVLGQKSVVSCNDFFKANENNDEVKAIFSKKFSECIYTWLNIKTDENYWKEYFRFEEIYELLLHTEKRVTVPFYEEIKKPGLSYKATFFLLTTPSDFYGVNVKTNMNNKDKNKKKKEA